MLESSQYGLPFKKQRLLTVSAQLTVSDMGGIIVVDSSGGPVTITLPPAQTVQAGAVFYVFAVRGAINPVTVTLTPGDSYDLGLTAPLVLDQNNQLLVIWGTDNTSAWLIPASSDSSIFHALATVGLAANQSLPGGALTGWMLAASLEPLSPAEFSLGSAAGVDFVEVEQPGKYFITMSANATNGGGSSRTNAEHTLFLDILGTGAYVPVPFSETSTYHRNAAAGQDGGASTVSLTLPAGARLTGGSMRISGTGTVVLLASGCSLTLGRYA